MKKEKVTVDVDEEEEKDLKEIDLSKFSFSTSTSISRSASSTGDLSVVNCKNGHRIEIPQRLLKKLGEPKTLQFLFSKKKIVFGEMLDQEKFSFSIKNGESKGMIYSSRLVEEITKKYNLDFSQRTCISLPKAVLRATGGRTVAVIIVLPKEEDHE